MSQFQESLPSTGSKAQTATPDPARRTSHPQLAHHVALVLGGGGAAGNAWEIGIIAGLAEAGLDMTEAADLVIGTSSGATAAAQLRSGIPPAELFASVLSPPAQPGGQNRERPSALPMTTVFDRMRTISDTATSAADLQRAMGAFGLECDSMLGPTAGQHAPWSLHGCPEEWGEADHGRGRQRATVRWLFQPRFGRRFGGRGHRGHCAAGFVPHCEHQRDALHQRRRALPRKRRPCLGPHERRGARAVRRTHATLPEGQFEGLRRPRNGAWTWRARSRLCVHRAAMSR